MKIEIWATAIGFGFENFGAGIYWALGGNFKPGNWALSLAGLGLEFSLLGFAPLGCKFKNPLYCLAIIFVNCKRRVCAIGYQRY
jgi:hypothetical protein